MITMTFGAEPTGTVSKVFAGTIGKLFEGGTRKALVRDLDDIAVVAESDDLTTAPKWDPQARYDPLPPRFRGGIDVVALVGYLGAGHECCLHHYDHDDGYPAVRLGRVISTPQDTTTRSARHRCGSF